jgi:cytosine/adenosine deaminase-related metal-dependent hydrolase
MTINAARAGFKERRKGSLEVGKLGDLVVLAGDPFRTPPGEIAGLEVAATVVGGRVMHRTDAAGLDGRRVVGDVIVSQTPGGRLIDQIVVYLRVRGVNAA